MVRGEYYLPSAEAPTGRGLGILLATLEVVADHLPRFSESKEIWNSGESEVG
jgi:hypothetical protein